MSSKLTSTTLDLIKQLKSVPRENWDEYFISTAFLMSTRSPSKKLRVGAVITKNNRIISAGYNGYFSGSKTDLSVHRDGHEMNTIHAEQNAITDAAKRGVSTLDTTIYITHYPCINCAKFIIASGIKHIKYFENYKNDSLVKDFFEDTSVSVEQLF